MLKWRGCWLSAAAVAPSTSSAQHHRHDSRASMTSSQRVVHRAAAVLRRFRWRHRRNRWRRRLRAPCAAVRRPATTCWPWTRSSDDEVKDEVKVEVEDEVDDEVEESSRDDVKRQSSGNTRPHRHHYHAREPSRRCPRQPADVPEVPDLSAGIISELIEPIVLGLTSRTAPRVVRRSTN